MIQRIYVDNYKCFSDFTFEPAQINLLVGANGAGKSALFEVLAAVRALVVDGEPAGSLFGDRTYQRAVANSRRNRVIELDVRLPSGLVQYHAEIVPHRYWEASVQTETLRVEDQVLYRQEDGQLELQPGREGDPIRLSFRTNRSYLASIEPKDAHPRIREFLTWARGAQVFDLRPEKMRGETEAPSPRLARTGENLASWYLHMHQDVDLERVGESAWPMGPWFAVLQQIELSLKSVLPDFGHMVLHPSDLDGGQRWRMKIFLGKRLFALDELSDGQRSLIALYFILHAIAQGPTAATLCFDEPDRHLNPREIQPWLFRLGEALRETGGQAFVISHHPEVIDYLATDHAWEFFQDEGGVAHVRPLEVDRETGLTASQWLASSPRP